MTISSTVFSSFLITLGALLGGIAWAGYFDRAAVGETPVAVAPVSAPPEKIVISAAPPKPGVTHAIPPSLLFRRERTRFVAATSGAAVRAGRDIAAAPVAYSGATRAQVIPAALAPAPAAPTAAMASASVSPAATPADAPATPRKPQRKQVKHKADANSGSGSARARQRPTPAERPAAAAPATPGSWLLTLLGVNTTDKK